MQKLRFILIFSQVIGFFLLLSSSLLNANELSGSQISANTPSWRPGPTTFGVGASMGTTAGFTAFFSPTGKDVYTQLALNFNTDGDYNIFLDGAYPISNFFSNSKYWDIYLGLGFLAGDLNRFPIQFGSKKSIDNSDLYFGLRVPVGFMYYIPRSPFQIGAEAAPSMVLAPKRIAHLHAAVVSRVVLEF